MVKKISNSELLANILWTGFGFIGCYNYYNKQEYAISGVMLLIGILYLFRVFFKSKKEEVNS